MKIAKKIYYDLATGNVIQEIGEREGSVVETTLDQDFESYASLTERVKDTIGVIQLEYGQYRDKFGVYYYNIVDNKIVWGDLINPDVPIPQPTNQEVMDAQKEIADTQMTMMDVIATMYEDMIAKGTV